MKALCPSHVLFVNVKGNFDQKFPLMLLLFAHLTKQYIVVDSIAKTWPGIINLCYINFSQYQGLTNNIYHRSVLYFRTTCV